MEEAGPSVSICPTFTPRSNTSLAGIAAKVVQELDSREEGGIPRNGGKGDTDFAFTTRDSRLSSPIPADEIFHNGTIRLLCPDVNRNSSLGDAEPPSESGNKTVVRDSNSANDHKAPRQLKKLFVEEREASIEKSTEYADLERLPAETHSVWRRKEAAGGTEGQLKKSGSTGNISRRWKFKDLLHRMHSRGSRATHVFSAHSHSGKKESDKKVKDTPPVSSRRAKPAPLL